MENFEGNYSRATKIKLPPGMKAQRLIIGRNSGGSLSPTGFDSDSVGLKAPFLKYLCGGGGAGGSPMAGKLAPRGQRSPFSAVENLIERSPSPAAYRTPVKAVEDEEVLVMDELPSRRSSRFSGSESSGSSGKRLFKAEIFQSSEESGDFRHSPKVQSSSAKEDLLRPKRLALKNKTEPQVNSLFDDSPGLFTQSQDTLFLPQTISPTLSEAAATPIRTASPTEPTTPVRSASPSESMAPNQPDYYRPPWSPNRPASPHPPTQLYGPNRTPSPATPYYPTHPYNPTRASSPAMPYYPTQPYNPTGTPSPAMPYYPTQPYNPTRAPSPVLVIPQYEIYSYPSHFNPNHVPYEMTSPYTPSYQIPTYLPPPLLNAPIPVTVYKPPTPRSKVTRPPTPRPEVVITSAPTPTTPTPVVAVPVTGSRTNGHALAAAEASGDWSPLDDGIEVNLPGSSPGEPPSRESVNAYIDSVLQSGPKKRRLPVFSEICPDSE